MLVVDTVGLELYHRVLFHQGSCQCRWTVEVVVGFVSCGRSVTTARGQRVCHVPDASSACVSGSTQVSHLE